MNELLRALANTPARIRRWLRPPRVLRPTRAGWLFLLIILGVGFAALNTGNNLLYLVLSLMLSFLVLSGVMSESALRGIRVRRRLPRELFAGRENSVRIEIRNTQKYVSAFAVAVEDKLLAAPDGRAQTRPSSATHEEERKRRRWRKQRRRRGRREDETAGRSFALRIGPGESESRRYSLMPDQRGPLKFAGFRVSTRFPFGLFLKYREFDAVEEALVYPELLPHTALPSIDETRAAGESTIMRVDAGGSVSGLREFVEGDSKRRIHWPSSMRRGSLLVIETEDDANADVEVRLFAAEQPARSGAAARFERRFSCEYSAGCCAGA